MMVIRIFYILISNFYAAKRNYPANKHLLEAKDSISDQESVGFEYEDLNPSQRASPKEHLLCLYCGFTLVIEAPLHVSPTASEVELKPGLFVDNTVDTLDTCKYLPSVLVMDLLIYKKNRTRRSGGH